MSGKQACEIIERTRLIILLSRSAYYVIGIPFGVWLAFSWRIGLHGLWLGLTASLIYCAVLGTYLCLRTIWDREVKKAAERLKKDEAKDFMNRENANDGSEND